MINIRTKIKNKTATTNVIDKLKKRALDLRRDIQRQTVTAPSTFQTLALTR